MYKYRSKIAAGNAMCCNVRGLGMAKSPDGHQWPNDRTILTCKVPCRLGLSRREAPSKAAYWSDMSATAEADRLRHLKMHLDSPLVGGQAHFSGVC